MYSGYQLPQEVRELIRAKDAQIMRMGQELGRVNQMRQEIDQLQAAILSNQPEFCLERAAASLTGGAYSDFNVGEIPQWPDDPEEIRGSKRRHKSSHSYSPKRKKSSTSSERRGHYYYANVESISTERQRSRSRDRERRRREDSRKRKEERRREDSPRRIRESQRRRESSPKRTNKSQSRSSQSSSSSRHREGERRPFSKDLAQRRRSTIITEPSSSRLSSSHHRASSRSSRRSSNSHHFRFLNENDQDLVKIEDSERIENDGLTPFERLQKTAFATPENDDLSNDDEIEESYPNQKKIKQEHVVIDLTANASAEGKPIPILGSTRRESNQSLARKNISSLFNAPMLSTPQSSYTVSPAPQEYFYQAPSQEFYQPLDSQYPSTSQNYQPPITSSFAPKKVHPFYSHSSSYQYDNELESQRFSESLKRKDKMDNQRRYRRSGSEEKLNFAPSHGSNSPEPYFTTISTRGRVPVPRLNPVNKAPSVRRRIREEAKDEFDLAFN